MEEGWYEDDPNVHWRDSFPYTPGTPGATEIEAENSFVVYAELDAGKALGTHTETAEEVIVLLDGEVEVTVGEEVQHLSAYGMTLVPSETPHSIQNVGEETAILIAVFPDKELTTTFEKPVMPFGERVFGFGTESDK